MLMKVINEKKIKWKHCYILKMGPTYSVNAVLHPAAQTCLHVLLLHFIQNKYKQYVCNVFFIIFIELVVLLLPHWCLM